MFKSIMTAAALTILAGAAPGQLISYEGFNYPAGSPLTSTVPGGTGWLGAWNLSGPGDWTVDTTGSSYSAGGWSLVTGGRRVIASGANVQRTMNVSPALGGATQTVWVSFLAQQTAGTSSSNWLGVKLPCTAAAGVNSFLFLGKPYNKPAWGTDAGSIPSHRQTAVAATSRAFIVARIDLKAGADDVYLWVNPSLAAAPALASADLSLPGYGNFEGITKVLAEVGGGNGMRGTVDEIRVGSDFRSVSPVRDGVRAMGQEFEAMGQAQLVRENDGTVQAVHIGGTGLDGVRVSVASPGSLVGFDVAPGAGQALDIAQRGTDGRVLMRETVSRLAGGVPRLQADLSGIPGGVTLRTQVVDQAGHVLLENTSPDMVADLDLSALMDLPCPDGTPRHWYRMTEIIGRPGYLPLVRVVWKYGCDEGADRMATQTNCVVLDATFVDDDGFEGNIPGGGGTTRIEATSGTMESFTVLRADVVRDGAAFGGLGDASVRQACPEGATCGDASEWRVLVGNDGATGSDGVRAAFNQERDVVRAEVRLGTPGDQADDACGAIGVRMTGRDGAANPMGATMGFAPDGLGGAVMTVNGLETGATRFEVSILNDGVVVWSGETTDPTAALVKYVNPWVKFWCEVGSTLWGLSAQFENYQAMSVGGGGGGGVGNEIVVQALDGIGMTAVDGCTVMVQDLAGPLSISDLTLLLASACGADFNQDGFVDFFDYDGFVGAFETGDPAADFNQDGFMDFFDYDVFVQAFEVGC